MNQTELLLNLILAGGGSSLLAVAGTWWTNRHKNHTDVQSSVNAMAKDWLDLSSNRIRDLERRLFLQDEKIESLSIVNREMTMLLDEVLIELSLHQGIASFRERLSDIKKAGGL